MSKVLSKNEEISDRMNRIDRMFANAVDWRKLMPVLIIAVGVLAYANSFSGVFIFDDAYTIRAGYRLWRSWLFGGGGFFSRRPVTDVTFALNYAVGQLKAADYHAVNLLIHLLASLLLYGVVRRTLELVSYPTVSRVATSIENSMLAFASAAIWVCHPLTTGAVTYISQRYESLMGMFYLLTLYCVIRGWYAGAVVACMLGMGSKEVMVTAPVAVLVYDWMFLSGSFRELAKKRWGLYVGLAGTWLILVLLMNVKLRLDETTFYAWQGIPPLSYAATQFGAICRYLWLAVWPVGLCFDYAWPLVEGIDDVLLPVVFVGLLLVGTVVGVLKRSGWGFPGAWFFLILAPTSSFIPRPDCVVEYRMYLPVAAVVVFLIIGAHAAYTRIFSRCAKYVAVRGWVNVTVLVAVIGALALVTVQRNRLYSSAEAVWRDVIAKRPDNHRAYLNLACALLDQEKFSEMAAVCNTLLVRLSGISDLTAEDVPARVRNADDARLHLNAWYYANAHNYLGVACAHQGMRGEAVAHFREASRIMPQFRSARDNLARALAESDQEGRPTD